MAVRTGPPTPVITLEPVDEYQVQGSNVTFTLNVQREDSSDDSSHTFTLYQAPSAGDPSRPASNDNSDVASLVSDLNTLLTQAGLSDTLEAGLYLPFVRDEAGTTYFARPRARLKWIPLKPEAGQAGMFAGLALMRSFA